MLGSNARDDEGLKESRITLTENCIVGSLNMEGSFIETVGTWRTMASLSQSLNCRKLLITRVPEGEFSYTELYEFGKSFSELGFIPGTCIAVVCSPVMSSAMKFLEDVITNRHSHKMRVFKEADSARRWLVDYP